MNQLLVIFILMALHASSTPLHAQPIQNGPAEETNGSEVAVNDDGIAVAAADVPEREATAVEYLAVSPQWFADDAAGATVEQKHERPARHVGFGGIGGGFVGGFSGGAIAAPVYSVPVVQTVPVITSVPVVSTISTYPSYGTGYGYGGYAPIGGFGGVGFGKFRSSFSAKGFGLGGGFIG